MSIVDDLKWRYACKEFDATKKLTEAQLYDLLEALRLTPSSFGMQPWKFIVVENPELREQLVEASWKQQQVKDASHLLVLCAPLKIDEKFVDDFLNSTAKTNLKIDCRPMEGFVPKKYDEILGLAKIGLTSVLVAPVGFRSESDKYSNLAKSRFTQDEVVIKI
jgi:nitroreductase